MSSPSARDVVTHHIAERAAAFPELDLTPLHVQHMPPRDASLARAIDQAVARRWLTLARLLDAVLDQDWERLQPTVQAPLLVGAAQLMLLDRLPDHAVINEAVNWTKSHARAKAGGLVNAVLRRVAALRTETLPVQTIRLQPDHLLLEDGRVRRLARPVFDTEPVRLLSQQTSHDEKLLAHWIATFGFEAAKRLALHGLVQPPIVLAGLSQVDAAGEATLSPHDDAGFFLFSGSHEQLVELLARFPHARVQDVTTARSVESTRRVIPKPRVIIEVCAGRGTKTKQLAQVHPEARLIATDIDPVRLAALREAVSHTGGGHRRVEVIEFAELASLRGAADLIVLDVPCSNTGVLARRLEAKYRFTRESLANVVKLQRQIIANSIPLLAGAALRSGEGGWMLYATCSIEPAENQEQEAWITRWHGMKPVESRLHMPRGLPGDSPASYADGGYSSLLRWGG